jgi:DNA topoisomerase-2
LLRQIGEKEVEIDVLIKLSKEDLWKKDLDDFIAEWRFQIEDEHQRARKVASLGRRASAKLKTGGKLGGAAAKKRKAQGDDDDDFDFAAPAKKKPIIKKIQPKAGLSNHMSPQRKASITSLNGYKPGKPISVDGGEDSLDGDLAPIFKKTKAAAKAKTAISSQDDDDMSIVSEAVAQPARRPRAVTKKAIKYLSSDSEDDDGDKLLGDITNMVKGTTGGGDSATETRTLFSTSHSRPGSSAGLSSAGLKSSKASRMVDTDDLSADETDYAQLVPRQSPRRSIVVTAKDTKLSEDDEDDSDVVITKPPKKVAAAKQTKAAPKTAAPKATAGRGRPKKTDAPVSKPEPAKKTQMSPTAKAYAARQAKATTTIIDSDDEIDTLANDILDSPAHDDRDESPAPRALPAGRSRRAASVKQPAYTIEDDSLMSPSEGPSSDVFSGSE